jgi:hypothetical protein
LEFRYQHHQFYFHCLTCSGRQRLRNYILIPDIILNCIISLLYVHEILQKVRLLKSILKRVLCLEVYLPLDGCHYPWFVLL